ncbi:hypothetical protein SERLA73DRAFT_72210 [Serpula lacrymans var. lacrymans S7.3]|uniref:Uncharacterized protein n=2 Tax=Serpula lacrymans var. lacrymans TaxID=341189 RepID=F8PS71_SERL3|nr:uncharacterized protein SERLADRAFT_414747 [Serpula lacrymans var. lacrymans S7.9]EGO01253.1 hypothetical protein SERLA73DRAFT_72210 [Serpula lacrymans var. lacrymans S7.3]EGO26899.1 hypothetical protein SERLADRAFT_414747 [Serpula lacrymans var. lacrymans S7.9]
MENRRAETLEALSAYIESQKALLARTQVDIGRLRKLRNDALGRPKSFMGNIISELSESDCKLSEQTDCGRALPEKIDWELFAARDSASLKALTFTTRQTHLQRNTPHTTQRSPLSSLQKLVKEARKAIVDPILFPPAANANTSSVEHISPSLVSLSLPSDGEEEHEREPKVQESVTTARRRERERAKIRELKKRKFGCGLTISTGPTEDGVFVRRDVGDESGEVDIWAEEKEDEFRIGAEVEPLSAIAEAIDKPMDVEESVAPPAPPINPPQDSKIPLRVQTQDLITAFPTDVALSTASSHNTRGSRKKSMTKSELEPEISVPPPKQSLGKRSRDAAEKGDTYEKETGKPKPETYKLAWSVSEQHLLERLLEEIPDGEKNRWQKISIAMKGRRTPRQVASRVQKYFEKLKRFGIGVDVTHEGKT